MKKYLAFFLMSILLLSACSASGTSDKVSSESSSNDMAIEHEVGDYEGEQADDATGSSEESSIQRKIIQRANLQLRVNDYTLAQANIEGKVKKYGGYIVESSIYHDEKSLINGYLIARIPAEHFESFLADTEKEATNVIERNVSGEDVTEQYIDLDARLSSKKVVEERLLNFLQKAEKTEDLLKISADLAIVQEEIESLVGMRNYLNNQTALSTVEISLMEDRVIMPEVGTKGFDTWEKTKKQFLTSIHFLLAFGSGLIVFVIGNLPILLIIIGVGGVVYFLIRSKIKREKKKQPDVSNDE